MKKLLLISLGLLLLTGCWDKRELNELGIVGAYGIDFDQNTGDVIVTTQIIRPSAMKKDNSGTKTTVEYVTTNGKTIFEAVRNAAKQFDRRAYYAQSKVLVISERMAKEKMNNVVDFLTRSPQPRNTAWIIIAKRASINEILTAKKGVEDIQANYLSNVIKESTANSEAVKTNVLEIIKKLSGNGIHAVAGVMEVIKENSRFDDGKGEPATTGVKYSGAAVFKRDKLIGYLDEKETRGFNWIMGKVKSGIINVPSPDNKDKYIAIEIKRMKCSIKPEISGGKISFDIQVKAKGTLVEEQSLTDISKLPMLEKIVSAQEDVIETEIKRAIQKVKEDLRSDVFGFGQIINQKYPQEWKRIKNEWDKIFPTVDCTVEVIANIRRTGLLQKAVNEPANHSEPEVKSKNKPQEMLGK